MNINLGTSTANTITGYVSGFLGDFSGYITLIIGMLVALFVIDYLIGLMLPDKDEEEIKKIKRQRRALEMKYDIDSIDNYR